MDKVLVFLKIAYTNIEYVLCLNIMPIYSYQTKGNNNHISLINK